jgi:hypothetical protein
MSRAAVRSVRDPVGSSACPAAGWSNGDRRRRPVRYRSAVPVARARVQRRFPNRAGGGPVLRSVPRVLQAGAASCREPTVPPWCKAAPASRQTPRGLPRRALLTGRVDRVAAERRGQSAPITFTVFFASDSWISGGTVRPAVASYSFFSASLLVRSRTIEARECTFVSSTTNDRLRTSIWTNSSR